MTPTEFTLDQRDSICWAGPINICYLSAINKLFFPKFNINCRVIVTVSKHICITFERLSRISTVDCPLSDDNVLLVVNKSPYGLIVIWGNVSICLTIKLCYYKL